MKIFIFLHFILGNQETPQQSIDTIQTSINLPQALLKLLIACNEWLWIVSLISGILGIIILWLQPYSKAQNKTPWLFGFFIAAIASIVPNLFPLSFIIENPKAYVVVDTIALLFGLIGIVLLLVYFVKIGSPAKYHAPERIRVCATCGAELKPEWNFCPNCLQKGQATQNNKTMRKSARYPTAPIEDEQKTIKATERRRPPVVGFLVIASSRRKGHRFDLIEEENIIGRGSECHIQLEDPDHELSRIHAKIRIEGGQFYIFDMGSSNGTFVNGEDLREIGKKLLNDGYQIEMGNYKFIFKRI